MSGYSVGRKRVRRLMRLLGLSAVYQAPKTSVKHPQHKVYPYLLRGLRINRPNQLWAYNYERPHLALDRQPPMAYRRQHEADAKERARVAEPSGRYAPSGLSNSDQT